MAPIVIGGIFDIGMKLVEPRATCAVREDKLELARSNRGPGGESRGREISVIVR